MNRQCGKTEKEMRDGVIVRRKNEKEKYVSFARPVIMDGFYLRAH